MSAEDTPEPADSASRSKRKKTSRACNHCHRSHMTCDSGRPCKRCVQRNLADTCQDAPRKKKKYLSDVPPDVLGQATIFPSGSFNIEQQKPALTDTYLARSATVPINMAPKANHIFPATAMATINDFVSTNSNPTSALPSQGQNTIQLDRRYPPDLKYRRTNFLSSAADMEYSTLSNIVQDNVMHSTSNENTPGSVNISPALSPHNLNSGASTAVYSETSPNTALNEAFLLTSNMRRKSLPRNTSSLNNSLLDSSFPKCDEAINQYFLGQNENEEDSMFPSVLKAIESLKESDPAIYYERNSRAQLSFAVGILAEDSHYTRVGNPESDLRHYFKEPEEIYEKVKKPYSYTPGYHSLIAYLRNRFPKEMLVKMAESMAAYRPSFIACTNSLKEHDLIFMEQCFQRTLLTYDNFIKVSGTPTIVWRRTGEIAYVGNEFCILTGWTKEELLSKRKRFIVELLDDKSVVEYFQLFARIAFGDFLGATMTECTLLTPKKDTKIRTGCMWTLKRDVFGIPMMIIGNFLPIL